MQPSIVDGWLIQDATVGTHKLWQPTYNWQMEIGSLHIPVLTGKEPCWFYRCAQRAVLGIRWKYIGQEAPKGWRKFVRLVRDAVEGPTGTGPR